MKLIKRLICMIRGCHYTARCFKFNALYFCTRCGRELAGRTLDDLRQMPPISDEELEDFKREIELEQA